MSIDESSGLKKESLWSAHILVAMNNARFLSVLGVCLALSWSQPAAAATLQVANQTDKPALFTVTYHTNLCKDDRGVHVAAGQTVKLKPGLCTVKTVYASITTRPGFALTCIPKNRTGASTYVVTIDSDLKDCHVN